MNAYDIIKNLYDGRYYSISPTSEERVLSSDAVFTIDGITFPLECIETWPEPRMATKEQLGIIVKALLSGTKVIKENSKNYSLMASIEWPILKSIIQHALFKGTVETLDDLYANLLTCQQYKMKPEFPIDNVLKFTNDEIYTFIGKKNAANLENQAPCITINTTIDFISSIKRKEPTIKNTFVNVIPNLPFSQTAITVNTHYIHRMMEIPGVSIAEFIAPAADNFNKNNYAVSKILGDCIDGKNAVISGGSVFDSIVPAEQPQGRDVDIFCNTEGFKVCFDRLCTVYKKIVAFTQYSSCVNLIIPGSNLLVQFIITDFPLSWIMGNDKRQGFDFDHLKIIMANNQVYLSYPALKCLIKRQTFIGVDVVGCPQPHRLAKAIRRLPFKKDAKIFEFSGHLIDKYIYRDDKYIYINDESPHRIDFLIRKIHRLAPTDNVYIIDSKKTQVINKLELIVKKTSEIEFDMIKNMEYHKKSEMETNSPISNNHAVVQTEKVEPKDFTEYEGAKKLSYEPIMIGDCGLMPPVVIIKTMAGGIVVKAFAKGPVINKVFSEFEYLIIDVPDSSIYKKGQVIYCTVKNSSSNKNRTVHIDHDNSVSCKKIEATCIIRYYDLDCLANLDEPIATVPERRSPLPEPAIVAMPLVAPIPVFGINDQLN